MKLDTHDIQHLADLACLELTETEAAQFREQLSSILEYEDKLRQVDISDTNPANELSVRDHPVRSDVVLSSDRAADIVNQAPAHRDNFIIVPPVFPKSDTTPVKQTPDQA